MAQVRLRAPEYAVGVRLRAGSPSIGCAGWESDKWQCQFARWKGMESSITLFCDTCLSEFDLG